MYYEAYGSRIVQVKIPSPVTLLMMLSKPSFRLTRGDALTYLLHVRGGFGLRQHHGVRRIVTETVHSSELDPFDTYTYVPHTLPPACDSCSVTTC